jgi:lactoylglutathione lyase
MIHGPAARVRKYAQQPSENDMNVSVDQFCINVSDLDRAVHFYETVVGLTVSHRIEIPGVSEVILAGATGNRIQLAWHHDNQGAIEHGNALWKLYLATDDCAALYQRAIDAGSESVMAPQRLAEWPVTAAFVKDPDGYLIEILQHHAS